MAQRTLHGLSTPEGSALFNDKNYRELSEIAEQAKRRAEVARYLTWWFFVVENTYAVSFLMIKIILVTGTLISYKNNVAGWESCTLLRDTWSLWWSWRDWTLIPFNNTTLCNNVKTVTMWKLSDYDSVICGREEETILSKDYQKMFFFFFWCFFSVYV